MKKSKALFSGRSPITAARRFLFLAVCGVSFLCCREIRTVDPQVQPVEFKFMFSPGDYFSYDNWKLDIFGQKIPSSYFRNSWTVLDSGKIYLGLARTSLVIDSTFDAANNFVRRDSLYFSLSGGDLYQWAFLHTLIEPRETVQVPAQWNRIVALSQPLGSSWVMARIDTGEVGSEIVTGRVEPTRVHIGPMTVNGEERALLSYRVVITKPGLDYIIWLTETPASIGKVFDDAQVLPNANLRELKIVRSGG